MVNGALERSLKYSMYSLGRILMAPSKFSKGKPLATSSARPKAKNPWGLQPLGFWPLVWLWMWPRIRLYKIPWGTFNLLPREYIEYSRGTPQELHSSCYLLQGFPFTLYTSRKPLQRLLATGVPSCEEPGSAHEQTCKISKEELPHPIKQRRDDLRKRNFFVFLSLQCRLLILEDSCAEWGWPDTLGTIQGVAAAHSPILHHNQCPS